MKKLKTLKDIFETKIHTYEDLKGNNFDKIQLLRNSIKQEAIKHIKDIREFKEDEMRGQKGKRCIEDRHFWIGRFYESKVEWIKEFFNISSKDLEELNEERR